MSKRHLPLASAALDTLAGEGRSLRFWWRDDDARTVTPDLERLLGLAKAHDLPLAVAAIADGAEAALAERIADEDGVRVLVHGYAHANHAPAGAKRAEFGDHRPGDAMAAEIAAAKARLEALFGGRLLPAFVPPWNRIGEAARALLPSLGLPVVSVYGPARAAGPGLPAELNTHLDVMDWRAMRGLSPAEADRLLAGLIEARATADAGGATEPIGLLTHHLQHDEAAWHLVEAVVALCASHRAGAWPALRDLVDARRVPGCGRA
ncbi:polysaccharide deacetylase [Jiella sonneratiae]|uniref:Polysaccharide deacetylase n=1 Tax=Jiella sonneratiae TaxID=2816856 RepID=A0ABS3J1W3_9HYPH|nr:polysaccharide deacetylase [Jiella sonneratiae]MBO0903662.1 polysaccharide deacetylase [Jiella sonneratiae]